MKKTKTPRPLRPRRPHRIGGLRLLDHNSFFSFRALRDVFRRYSFITIGRTPKRNIRLRDESVSKAHAKVEIAPSGEYIIRNWRSDSGIYVARYADYSEWERVDHCALRFGIHIALGDSTLTPVDHLGEAPILAANLTEYAQGGERLYGSFREAERHTGIERRSLSRLASK